MTEYMTLGEANWILWGGALQVGLCPLDLFTLTYAAHEGRWLTAQHCGRCHRDWYLSNRTGRCVGWLLTPEGLAEIRRQREGN